MVLCAYLQNYCPLLNHLLLFLLLMLITVDMRSHFKYNNNNFHPFHLIVFRCLTCKTCALVNHVSYHDHLSLSQQLYTLRAGKIWIYNALENDRCPKLKRLPHTECSQSTNYIHKWINILIHHINKIISVVCDEISLAKLHIIRYVPSLSSHRFKCDSVSLG